MPHITHCDFVDFGCQHYRTISYCSLQVSSFVALDSPVLRIPPLELRRCRQQDPCSRSSRIRPGRLSTLVLAGITADGRTSRVLLVRCVCYLSGTLVQGLLVLNYSDYNFHRWHRTLLFYVVIAFTLSVNTYLARILPRINEIPVDRGSQIKKSSRRLHMEWEWCSVLLTHYLF